MSYDAQLHRGPRRPRPGPQAPGDVHRDHGSRGLHHLVYEVVDNSIDEALAGYCNEISVAIHADNSVTVTDDGRGIPVDMHTAEKQARRRGRDDHACTPAASSTTSTYKVSGGLHGVGVSVVNALSEWLDARDPARRQGLAPALRARRARSAARSRSAPPTRPAPRSPSGPTPRSSASIEFRFDMLSQRLRELSFLNAGLRIQHHGRAQRQESHDFCYEGGIVSFVEHLNRSRAPLHQPPIFAGRRAQLRRQGGREVPVSIEIALQYNETYNESVYSLREQHQHGRGRHAPDRLPHRAHARAEPLHHAPIQERQGRSGGHQRRRHPRGSDRGDLREAPAARVRGADQDEARHQRGARPRRGHASTTSSREYLEENPAVAQPSDREGARRPRARARRRARRATSRAARARSPTHSLPGKLADCQEREPVAAASSSSSRAIRPAAPPSRAAPARPRRSCRSAARS